MFVGDALYLAVRPRLPHYTRDRFPPVDILGSALVVAAYPAATAAVSLGLIPSCPASSDARIALPPSPSGRVRERSGSRSRPNAEPLVGPRFLQAFASGTGDGLDGLGTHTRRWQAAGSIGYRDGRLSPLESPDRLFAPSPRGGDRAAFLVVAVISALSFAVNASSPVFFSEGACMPASAFAHLMWPRCDSRLRALLAGARAGSTTIAGGTTTCCAARSRAPRTSQVIQPH